MFIGVKSGRDEKERSTIANTSEAQFKVEFECEFLGSVDTLISPSKLRALVMMNHKLEVLDWMYMKHVKKIMIMYLLLM